MRKLLLVLIGAALSLPSPAQDTHTSTLTDAAALPQVLNFEDQKSVGPPAGWVGKPEGTVLIDDKIVHGGHWAARLERQADSPGAFPRCTSPLQWICGHDALSSAGSCAQNK
jgi:hypothetical protein